MHNTPINFRRQRELGEIITDTFKFLRENYRPLFKIMFKTVGPIFLILTFALGFYSYIGGETMQNPFLASDFEGDWTMFFLSVLFLIASLLSFFALLQGTVFHFINSYIKNGGNVNEQEVRTGVKTDFGKILGVMVLTGILLVFGLLLCVIPGIYLWVPLSLAIPAVVFGRYGIGDSIGQTFKLIKDNWWMTFFSLFVLVLLVYIIALVFQIPIFIYFLIKMITIVQEGSAADPSSLFDWVYVVLSVISSLAQYLLTTVIFVALAFIYFNLDEKKNFTGSYEVISNLGSQEKD